MKDWVKSGNKTYSAAPLPEIKVHFIDVDELQEMLEKADQQSCKDKNSNPLITLLDFRMSPTLQAKMRADNHQIQSTCNTIKAQLDDFIDNRQLIDSLPETGQVISISETGNRDRFLVQYLSQFGKTNIRALKYGMRNWLKAGYPTEKNSSINK